MSGHKYEETTILSMFSHWNSAPLDTNPMNFSNSVQYILYATKTTILLFAGDCDFATTTAQAEQIYIDLSK